MYLQYIHIQNYKNIADTNIEFGRQFNYLIGRNGMGKTNMMDAVYFLAMGKSYGQLQDKSLIRHEEDYLRLEAIMKNEVNEMTLVAKLGKNHPKSFEKDGTQYQHISDHIGQIPIVFITPADGYNLFSASMERRRFIDRTIGQVNGAYLRELIQYNKLLKHRNASLKTGVMDNIHSLLDTYDEQMGPLAHSIVAQRNQMIEQLQPSVAHFYERISEGKEKVSIHYESELLSTDFISLSKKNRQRDIILRRTHGGTHKDDLKVVIDGQNLKKFASQGQLKSFILGLKLAQFMYLSQKLEKMPILLIDDVFAKLDEHRVQALLGLLDTKDFGQIFITDTSIKRMQDMRKHVRGSFNCYELIDGAINQLDDEQ